MKDLEIQEQSEKMYPEYPTEPKGGTRYNKDINCFKKRKAFMAGAQWIQERDNKLIHKYTQEQIHRDTLGLPMVSYQDWNSNLPSPPKTK